LIRPAVTPGHSTILLLQNGLNIEVPLLEAFPDNVILSGISVCGSSEPESGVIEHNIHDELSIGPFRDMGNAADRAKDLVARYNAGGRCTCHYDSNVAFSRWKKLLYNAVYNPVAALTRLDTGDLQLCPGLIDEVVRPGMKEIQAAAAAYGQEITDEMIEATITTEPIEAHVPPSMLVDVRKVSTCANIDGLGCSHNHLYIPANISVEPVHRVRKPHWRAPSLCTSPTGCNSYSAEPLLAYKELSVEA
jgi:ketopantoate reductase